MRQGKLSELIHNPIRYLDLNECSGEVLFRAIIDLLRSFTRTSHSTSSSPHPTCILSSKALVDRGDGEGEVGFREEGGAGVVEASERASEGSRVSPDCGSTICGKCLENHEQFVAQIVCFSSFFLLSVVLMPGVGIFGEGVCGGVWPNIVATRSTAADQ